MTGGVVGHVETSSEEQLRGLAETIAREYEGLLAAAGAMVEHAVAIGEALLAAKAIVPPGEWTAWVTATLPNGRRRATVSNYMRLASLKEHIDPELSVTSNLLLLRGMPSRNLGTPRVDPAVKARARELLAAGDMSMAAIARECGTTQDSVRAWADPDAARAKIEANSQRRRAARAAARRTANLEDLDMPAAVDERALKYGEPGRAAVGRAVRRLAQVQGAAPTHEALLDLIAVAGAWANHLAEGTDHLVEAA